MTEFGPDTRVLVTGGAKRFGAALVRKFSSLGARVLIHFNSSADEAEALLNEIGGPVKGHALIRYDLSENPEGFPMPEDVSILVNNASVFVRKTAPEETLSALDSQFAVNFRAPAALMNLLYRRSKCAEPCVVNMLDCMIAQTPSDSFGYALSKKALAEATKAAALQYAPRMRVNGVAPGPVIPPPGFEHGGMKKTLPLLPLGRPVALDDLADTVVFAARNRSMTGSILFVDCGRSLRQIPAVSGSTGA